MAAMLKPAQPIEVPDWPALVRETRRLMHAGAAEICQAGLEVRLAEGLRLRGRPDLLRRNNEPSRLGPWSYTPVEMKQHCEATSHDVMQLDLYRWMLGEVVGRVPDGELWLGDQNGIPTIIHRQGRLISTLEQTLQRVQALRASLEPAIWFAPHCQYCPWRAACSRQAEERQDIALLTKLDRRTAAALRANGITVLSQIAQLSAAQLARYPHAGPMLAPQIRVRAQALLAGTPIRSTRLQSDLAAPALLLDLESHPDSQVPWAFGWIDADGLPAVAIVAPPRPASAPVATMIGGLPVIFVRDASVGWRHIAQLAQRRSGHIFHWGEHERHSLTRSASTHVTDLLRSRMANLHADLALRYTLPIPRGAAQTAGTRKAVGGYLGQRWPADVDWSTSWSAYVTWRQQTREALFQRRPWADAIDAGLAPAMSYLQADLEALRRIWQWLKAREAAVAYA